MSKHLVFFLIVFFNISAVFSQQFKTHTVKEGETVTSIAQLYNIKPADVLRLNPEIKGKLKINTILVIPPALNSGNQAIIATTTIKQEVTFKQHKVKRRETLFSISRRYDITVEDIKRYNRELYSRDLKKGERIRIPKFLKPELSEVETDSIPDGLMIYKVEPKEGKWRVAYKNGITIKELEDLNPEIGEILKEGQEVYVPSLEETEEKKEVIDSIYSYYTVKPKEGFFRLKIKLGISEDEIRVLNPELQNGELLKNGMVIKIPKNEYNDHDLKDGLIVERFSLIDSIKLEGVSNIALIMPFRLNKVDTDSLEGIKQQIKKSRLLGQSLDFYTGVRMALDSAKQLGLSVNVKVFDSERNENIISNILATSNFENTDAVIGPFFSKPFNKMAAGLKDKNIPVFAPFSKNIELQSNVFQTLPSDEVLYNKMTSYLDKEMIDKNLIIIADSLHTDKRDRLLTRYPSAKILDPIKNSIKIDQLKPFLVLEKENWVVVETKSVSLLANITSVLNSSMVIINDDQEEQQFDIRMFTTNKNRAYDNNIISNIDLSNLKFHYPTVDRFSSTYSEFSKKYRKQFGSLPTRFAIRGFDLTMDVLLRLAYQKDLFYGANLISETEYIENKFNYNGQPSGGYLNTAVYIAYYDELEIKLIK